MDINEGMEYLRNLYKDKEWYHSVGLDQYGRIVVYIHFSTHETLRDIPDRVANKQVLTHFAASLCLDPDKYVNRPTSRLFPVATGTLPPPIEDQIVDVVGSLSGGTDTQELSIRYLENELDRLERACGSNTLQDIFYEIKDAHNAVTNLSARYPEVRTSLERLFDQYGFDVIYENLDG
jgi:hypothetical protein